jgi:hypothetical protein
MKEIASRENKENKEQLEDISRDTETKTESRPGAGYG